MQARIIVALCSALVMLDQSTAAVRTTSVAAEPGKASGKAGAQRPFRGGSFDELRRLPPIHGRVIVCMPALSVFLAHQEARLGRPLTEKEFQLYRDMAPAIEMDRADADAMRKGEPLPADMTFAMWQSMRKR